VQCPLACLKVPTTEAADSFEAILRKPSFTDCLIEADRTQYEGQNSHERPTYGRSRRHGVAYDPNAKGSYSCRNQQRERSIHMRPFPGSRSVGKRPPTEVASLNASFLTMVYAPRSSGR
jgi:hypothetical protein